MIKLLLLPLRRLFQLPLAAMLRLCRQRCRGVWVADLTCDTRPDFCEQVARALDFIERHDPRRFAWVESSLSYIVNATLIRPGGLYLTVSRACLIRYDLCFDHVVGEGQLTERRQQVLTMKLASTILHEATHARIDQAGVSYSEQYRERIERFCHRQEMQFMARAAADFTDVNGDPIDWSEVYNFERVRSWYDEYWEKSRWEHTGEVIRAGFRVDQTEPESEPDQDDEWPEVHQSYWSTAASIQPLTDSMLATRGSYYYAANNCSLAAADLRRVVARDPENEDARYFLAAAMAGGGDEDEALQIFRELYQPGAPMTAAWVSRCLWNLDRCDEALRWLEKEDWEYEPAWLTYRAMLLADLGKGDEALGVFDRLLDSVESTGDVEGMSCRAVRALLLEEAGDHRGYEDALRELASIRKWWWDSSESEPVATEAIVINANARLREPGVLSEPASLLICPAGRGSTYLRRVAGRLNRPDAVSPEDYESAYRESIFVRNEQYPWREVPPTIADEEPVFVVDAYLDRIWLPGRRLEGDLVRCWISDSDPTVMVR